MKPDSQLIKNNLNSVQEIHSAPYYIHMKNQPHTHFTHKLALFIKLILLFLIVGKASHTKLKRNNITKQPTFFMNNSKIIINLLIRVSTYNMNTLFYTK